MTIHIILGCLIGIFVVLITLHLIIRGTLRNNNVLSRDHRMITWTSYETSVFWQCDNHHETRPVCYTFVGNSFRNSNRANRITELITIDKMNTPILIFASNRLDSKTTQTRYLTTSHKPAQYL